MERSWIQDSSSHENESHHALIPILSCIISTSELTGQWQQVLVGDAAPR